MPLAPQDEIGAAARLAVDNERLRAEVLARVADLRASRARIVATADGTRQRLERDLHDGAQQQLLAASFELRQACSSAAASGDAELAARLTDASEQAQQALTELRDLAHGIYPAILTEAGLEPAVRSLAERASTASRSCRTRRRPVPDCRREHRVHSRRRVHRRRGAPLGLIRRGAHRSRR